MIKQRKVNGDLGRNQTKDHERIYIEIEKNIGSHKICNFGYTRGSKTGVKHEGEKNLPIRDFELRGARIVGNKVVIKGCGLQGFCRTCSQRRRKVRTSKAKKENVGGYETYIAKYKKETKECSRCKIDKDCREFSLSSGMECGLHNMCKLCCYEYGESLGDRWILYRPDGNFKYQKKEEKEHDDHIFPLALGGSNEAINHQLLAKHDNLTKSSKIVFQNIHEIDPLLLSERFRHILISCQKENSSINTLESRLREAIFQEHEFLINLDDDEMYEVFREYSKKWNLRKNCQRAVHKFREFYNMRYEK